MFRKLSLNIFTGNQIGTRKYVRRGGKNPGLNKHIKVFENTNEQIENAETFENFESDFMNVHEMHKEYQKETKSHNKKIQLWMVKNKYFQQKLPNFLTYAEKEQMKYLHTKDPNEWTPERLSESFPADSYTISKILNSKWSPISSKRIQNHDENVLKNWETFRQGKFTTIEKRLEEHLLKFAKRNSKDLQNMKIDCWQIKTELPKPEKTEFLDIIKDCKKKKKYQENDAKLLGNPEEIVESKKFQQIPDEDETFLNDRIINKKPKRFQDLNIENSLESESNQFQETTMSKDLSHRITSKKLLQFKDFNQEISENIKNDEINLNQFKNPAGTGIIEVNNENNNKSINKFRHGSISVDESIWKSLEIKERILIPRKVWKRGATYKFDDCFYDDDGTFLYRVPGLTKN